MDAEDFSGSFVDSESSDEADILDPFDIFDVFDPMIAKQEHELNLQLDQTVRYNAVWRIVVSGEARQQADLLAARTRCLDIMDE